MDTIFLPFTLFEPKIFLVCGILLQIIVCFMVFSGKENLGNKQNKSLENTQKKSFSFIMNKVILYRLLLLLGMLCVNMVAIFESDYILFVGQCLLFALMYPANK